MEFQDFRTEVLWVEVVLSFVSCNIADDSYSACGGRQQGPVGNRLDRIRKHSIVWLVT
jgi:hypothetical protein